MKYVSFIFFTYLNILTAQAQISSGVDVFFDENLCDHYRDKKTALIVNHTSLDKNFHSTIARFLDAKYNLVALFTPEHGLTGHAYAGEKTEHHTYKSLPVYSLHGKTRRPTTEMLQGIELIIYDMQCTGVRAYTYPSTLFYMMEEAAKAKIPLIVLDRPNPIGGLTVDGPMLEEKWRSFIGYINVPYCHGMTIGELARFFNSEYQINCDLHIVEMKGWRRSMTFRDTGLPWIPPSPNIPEADTPIYSSTTGLLGELGIANIGIGYTLPFKIVGAPWIQAIQFAENLNAQHLPGVYFQPYFFRPFYGEYKGLNCEGVLIQITDIKKYRPLSVQYLLLGILKSLYPEQFLERITQAKTANKDLFCKANGTEEIYKILVEEKYPAWKLIEFQKSEREEFLKKRKKYLLSYPN